MQFLNGFFQRIPGAPALTLLAALAPGAAVAEVEPDEGVRPKAPLYTNADVARLEPIAVDDGPAVVESADDWYFILLMLDRERQRVEADRFDRRERDRLEAAERLAEGRDRPRVLVPYGLGLGGFVFSPSFPGSGGPPGEPAPFREPTADEIERARVRVPFDQRGIRSAGDAFREGRDASQKRVAETLRRDD